MQKKRDTLKSIGFVLLELLIAIVILFGVVGLGTQIYSSSIASARTATAHIQMATYAPLVADEIEAILDDHPASNTTLSGEGLMWDISYSWEATITKQSQGPSYYDDTTRKMVESPNTYVLWDIDVGLTFEGKSQAFNFTYQTRLQR